MTAPQSNLSLRSARFRQEREADWRRLDEIVSRVEKRGVRVLSFEDARDLATLYRQATNSLSVAREISLDKALLTYLEALAARAYLAVYAPQQSLGGLLSRFFLITGPAAMRRSALHILLATFCLFLGGAVGWLLFIEDTAWYQVLGPANDPRGPQASTDELLSYIYDEEISVLSGLGAFAAFLFSHNTRIAIMVFALGVFAGLPSALLLFYNGLGLGAFVALHFERGIGWDIFAWLSIHGVTELGAICVAGGGAFRLGQGVLFPGQRSRRSALSQEGKDATKLAIIAAIMLVVAALLEGFGRQLVQDATIRVTIGWSIGALWLAWFALAGRRT